MLDLKEKVIIGADMHKLSDQISVLAEALDQITGTSGNLVVKSKLPPRSGSSLEAVEPHP